MLRVKEICSEKGFTLAWLADSMGISAPSLSSAVNGNPTVGMLKKIADALGVTIPDLFERADEVRLFAEYGGERHEITHSDIIQIIKHKKATP